MGALLVVGLASSERAPSSCATFLVKSTHRVSTYILRRLSKVEKRGTTDFAVVVIFPAFPRPTDPPLVYPYLIKDSLLVLSFSYLASFYCAMYNL